MQRRQLLRSVGLPGCMCSCMQRHAPSSCTHNPKQHANSRPNQALYENYLDTRPLTAWEFEKSYVYSGMYLLRMDWGNASYRPSAREELMLAVLPALTGRYYASAGAGWLPPGAAARSVDASRQLRRLTHAELGLLGGYPGSESDWPSDADLGLNTWAIWMMGEAAKALRPGTPSDAAGRQVGHG